METSEQTHLTHPASKIHPQGIGSPPIQNLKRSKPLGPSGSPLYSTSSAANHYDQHGQQDNGTVDWTTKTQDKQERTPLTGGRAQNKRANGTWVRTKLTSKKNTIKGYYSKPKTQWTKRVTLRAMTHRWNKQQRTQELPPTRTPTQTSIPTLHQAGKGSKHWKEDQHKQTHTCLEWYQ